MATKASKIIGLKDLRENTEKYIKRVNRGETLTVMRRSTPIFKLTPIDEDEMGWETIIDFTEINPNGVPIQDVLTALKELREQD